MSERTHFVYEAYDADGLCLYVGCTGNLSKRLASHRRGNNDARGWFDPFVTNWRVSGPYPKTTALRIETERIDSYQPIWNGHSFANRNGRRQLITDYLAHHGVKFVDSHVASRPTLVPAGRRKRRHLRAIGGAA